MQKYLYKQKLTPAEIRRLAKTILLRDHPITVRNLLFKKHGTQWFSLCVSPFEKLGNWSYFWWDRGIRPSPPKRENVLEYWETILTLLNENPTFIVDEHRRKKQQCLYYYRPRREKKAVNG